MMAESFWLKKFLFPDQAYSYEFNFGKAAQQG